MADHQGPQIHKVMARKTSPPPSPPSPDPTDSELKLPLKREREVSLEPATTPSSSAEIDSIPRDRKDSRTPAKKNRRHLDTTVEEEDVSRSRSNSGSPPLSVSPPQEMKIKVRQISQGVEDLSWRNMQGISPDKDEDIDTEEINMPVESNGQTINPDQDVVLDTQVDDNESPPKSPDDSQMSKSNPDVEISVGADAETKVAPGIASSSRLRSDSESGEKGLKRKFLERGTSQGPSESVESAQYNTEVLKRPRDNPDRDDDLRETKRPSPPPEPKSPPRTLPPSPKVPKLSGFAAYASASSPFASVKGQSLFGSSKSSPSSFSSSTAPSTSLSGFGAKLGESSGLTSGAPKRTGFDAFSSSASPFASVARTKSPVLGSTSKLGRAKSPPRRNNSSSSNPFASYVGPLQGFAIPVQKRARAGSPDGSSRSSLERNPTVSFFGELNNGSDSGAEDDQDDRSITFGEKLRAGKDEEEDSKSEEEQSKVPLEEQDVMTGEEDEETIMQVRGKLFSLRDSTQWKERGTGILKLNVKRDDGSSPRLVMRKEAVYALLLNVTLFPGMRCSLAQDPRYLRFSVIENGSTTHYNLRVANAKIAKEFLEEVVANIPAV